MAAHFPLDDSFEGTPAEVKAIQRILHGVNYDVGRSYTGLRGSLKYERLPEQYLEENDTAVFVRLRGVTVPQSMVWGGKAGLEVHVGDRKLNKVYLVA